MTMIVNSVMIVMVVVILMLTTTTTTMMMIMMMTIVWRGRAVVGPEPAGFGWERHARLRLATYDGPTQRFIARLHCTSCFLHAENILLCRNMVSSNHNFSFNFCVTKKVNLNFWILCFMAFSILFKGSWLANSPDLYLKVSVCWVCGGESPTGDY